MEETFCYSVMPGFGASAWKLLQKVRKTMALEKKSGTRYAPRSHTHIRTNV